MACCLDNAFTIVHSHTCLCNQTFRLNPHPPPSPTSPPLIPAHSLPNREMGVLTGQRDPTCPTPTLASSPPSTPLLPHPHPYVPLSQPCGMVIPLCSAGSVQLLISRWLLQQSQAAGRATGRRNWKTAMVKGGICSLRA